MLAQKKQVTASASALVCELQQQIAKVFKKANKNSTDQELYYIQVSLQMFTFVLRIAVTIITI